ncbi:MAG: DUF2157 domain-containing protein [Candidatus Woesearchaeota archaeon]
MLNKKGVGFSTIMATLGVILIGMGFAWLIAQNWHILPSAIKIILMVTLTSAAYFVGVILQIRKYEKISHVVLLLGSFLYSLSIFLIAQIFHTSTSIQGTAYLFLLAWLGVIAAAYIFNSSPSLVLGLVEFFIWIVLQYFAFIEMHRYDDFSFGLIVLIFLAIGVLLYGLYLIHKSKALRFARVYQWWTAAYFLLFGYCLSFQSFLPLLSLTHVTALPSTITFLAFISVLALITFFAGIIVATGNKSVTSKELIGVGLIIVLLLILILFASIMPNRFGNCYSKSCYDNVDRDTCLTYADSLGCEWNYYQDQFDNGVSNEFSGRGYCSVKEGIAFQTINREISSICREYNNNPDKCLSRKDVCSWSPTYYYSGGWGRSVPMELWVLWIFSNIVFLGLILSIILYGTWQKLPKIVNLGIFFFVLNVISRYIGFLMDYGGYLGFAFVLISGGLLLIFGGWGIEKWRRNLVNKTRKN